MPDAGHSDRRRAATDTDAVELLIPVAEALDDKGQLPEPHIELDADLTLALEEELLADDRQRRAPRLLAEPGPGDLESASPPAASQLPGSPGMPTRAPSSEIGHLADAGHARAPAGPEVALPIPGSGKWQVSDNDLAPNVEPVRPQEAVSQAPTAPDGKLPGLTGAEPGSQEVLRGLDTDEISVANPEAALVAHLRAHGKLSDGDLARARKLADDGGEALRSMLVRLGLVSDRDMAAAYASVLNLELIAADEYPDAPVAEAELSLRFLKDARMVPLREDDLALDVAVADPVDSSAVRAVEMAVGRPVRLRVGLPTEIDAALERLYEAPEPEEADAELDGDLGNFSEEDIEHLRDLASEAPIIRLVNQIMQRAVESRASDVHIEPFADELKVRYRIDGILKESESPPVRSTAAVISRIKIMAKLNIAERRLPQDGRIPLRIQGKELDLRVSTVPTMFGESVVMRLLDKESVRFDFDALGFDGPPRERVLGILDQPYGIFLVTGPTGSGKSTTLYTALSRLNTEARKIITVEDPVEYQVPGINQIPVKASIGMTFAHALRAIVRQDPDVIMVGEMRDLETARIAVQSALTGHVVLSTLHTNDAASGVTRLLDMGVEDYLLTSTINGILAQRLVRRLCPDCREPFRPRPEMAARFLNLPGVDDSDLTLYHPRGCDACQGSGYRGRLVIAEVLMMTDRIRQAVLNHATATEIGRIAVEQDMLSMYQDGLRKAAGGHTTVEEVLRVASVTDD
jgi:general secretion pathway protein E